MLSPQELNCISQASLHITQLIPRLLLYARIKFFSCRITLATAWSCGGHSCSYVFPRVHGGIPPDLWVSPRIPWLSPPDALHYLRLAYGNTPLRNRQIMQCAGAFRSARPRLLLGGAHSRPRHVNKQRPCRWTVAGSGEDLSVQGRGDGASCDGYLD